MNEAVVSVVRCESYDEAVVGPAVRRAIDLLGLKRPLVGAGEKVLLKPSVIGAAAPEEAATTHPAVLTAVARLLREEGADLCYGDSPGGIISPLRALRKAGLHEAAEAAGVPLADFVKGRWVSYPEGRVCKRLLLAEGVLAADAIVGLPKLKAHGLTRLTGAVKNQLGCVPGVTKGEYHAQFPSVYDFAGALVDICLFVRPRLHVMDGVVAMEGNGPRSGDPRKLGVILASTDPVALDVVASMVVALDPTFVPTTEAGARAGLGIADPERIRVVGESIESVREPGFRIQRRRAEAVPSKGIRRVVRRLAARRPKIERKVCTRCGRCVDACPVRPRALGWVGGREGKAPPRFDYRRCIRCYCCQEMCPAGAVRIHTPVVRLVLPPLSYLTLLANKLRNRRREGRL